MTTMKNIITKIVGWLNKIGADKYKHFAVGAVMAAVVIMALALFVPKWAVLAASVVAVAVAAIGKEHIDDEADDMDIVATCLGGLIVCVTYLIG